MTTKPLLALSATVLLPKPGLADLLAALRAHGYTVHGPRVCEGVVRYGEVTSPDDLPRGYVSHQQAGRYRLEYTGHGDYFAVTPGPDAWKQDLFPPRQALFHLRRHEGDWEVVPAERPLPAPLALLGVRPCELAAMHIQDRVFLRADFADPYYRTVRAGLFLVAVNCLHPAETCFCAALDTGPEATQGYDLLLTELDDAFLVTVGSEAGREILQPLPWQPASAFALTQARQRLEAARARMTRRLPAEPQALPDLLFARLEHPYWEEVAARCLSCANCTQVCPTCFCWDVEDHIALDGEQVTRFRVWDSCFSPQLSHLGGGQNARPLVRDRYRQWLMHKFASWQRQFGTLGCVGCGRCITWCPAGIDITEELAALLAQPADLEHRGGRQ